LNSSNKLLVVDDDIAFLKVMEEMLKDHYEVSLAKSGHQAVRFLEKSRWPDMILLDIVMPDMNGFETLLRLRAMNQDAKVPIIYLTGLGGTDSEAHGLRLGAVDYIRKPVAKDVLLARISIHLSLARSDRQLDILKKNQAEAGGFHPDGLLQMEQLLTKTEFAVAMLVAQGYTNGEIGRDLNYSPAYVKKVVSRILARLDIGKRSEVKHFFSADVPNNQCSWGRRPHFGTSSP
jgi:DNA-binding response OmpR family regulator